jgi:hypothetical protein
VPGLVGWFWLFSGADGGARPGGSVLGSLRVRKVCPAWQVGFGSLQVRKVCPAWQVGFGSLQVRKVCPAWWVGSGCFQVRMVVPALGEVLWELKSISVF